MDHKNHRNNPNKYYNFTPNLSTGRSCLPTGTSSKVFVSPRDWVPECSNNITTIQTSGVFLKNERQDPGHTVELLSVEQNQQVDSHFHQQDSLLQIEDISLNWKEYILKSAILSQYERDSQKYDESYYDMIEPRQKFWKSLASIFERTVNESEYLKYEHNKYFYTPASSIYNVSIMRVREWQHKELREHASIIRLLLNFEFKNLAFSTSHVRQLYKKLFPKGHYVETVFAVSGSGHEPVLLYVGSPVFENLKNSADIIKDIERSLSELGTVKPVQPAPKDYEQSFMYKNNLIMESGHVEREAAEANILTIQKLNQESKANTILESVASSFTNVLFSSRSSVVPPPPEYQICMRFHLNSVGSTVSPISIHMGHRVYKLPTLLATFRLQKNSIISKLQVHANMNVPLSVYVVSNDGKILLSKNWGTSNTVLHFNRQWIDDICHSDLNDSYYVLKLHNIQPTQTMVYGTIINLTGL